MGAVTSTTYDAVIIGSGPNGLTAAAEIARTGRSVLVLEGAADIGGGMRTGAATLPGHVHDLFSAIHPLGASSPAFNALPLAEHGLEWIHPPAPLAHPLDGAEAAVLYRSPGETACRLGADGRRYRRLMSPLIDDWDRTIRVALSPTAARLKRPVASARLGLRAARPATALAQRFDSTAGRALLAGSAAHTGARLDRWFTGGVGLFLMAAGHAVGWPMARGGSGSIAASLASVLGNLGATIETGTWVSSLDDLPPARAILFDTAPEALVRIAGGRLPASARRLLDRHRPGPGVFKVDWALTGPIPWTDPACHESGTVHLGGTMEEIAAAEAKVAAGGHPEQPFVILAQQSLFDPGRAPARCHTAWAYCHVPNGSTVDQTEVIERQVERFAPGFRDAIAARQVMGPADLEARNPNLTGGDIAGGRFAAGHLLFGPVLRPDPYRVPGTDFYICSASAPPGAGVHGMCGFHAARSALRNSLG